MSAGRTELIELSALDDRDLGAWRELSARAVEPNPYWHPDFVLAAARGLGEHREVAVVRTLAGGDWSACVPVRRYSRWRRLPLPCVASWRHRYCLLGTPLLARECPPEDLRALVERMMHGSRGVAFSALDWVGAEGAVAEALERAPARRRLEFERFSRPTLRRRPQPDYLDGRVKGKHRREFRRLAQALEQELGGGLALVDRSDDPTAVDAFMDLESSGWKGRAGTALASNPDHAELFRRVTRAFSARGALELLFLEAGGDAVAARCSLLEGEAAFLFKVAYDERYKRYSPGRELELRQIDRFHAETGLVWMDSCTAPGNQLYSRLWPDRRELVTCAYPARGPLGVAARPAIRAAIAVRDRRREPTGDPG